MPTAISGPGRSIFPKTTRNRRSSSSRTRSSTSRWPPATGVLARLERKDSDVYEARPIRRLQARADRVVGVIEKAPHGTGRLVPTSKRIKTEFSVDPKDLGGARGGDIVVAEVEPAKRMGTPRARVVERIGRVGEAKAVSMISIAEHHIPFQFPPAALEQAEAAVAAPLGNAHRSPADSAGHHRR